MEGKLYLIPSTLGEVDPAKVIPHIVFKVIQDIEYYIVENEKSARRFLIKMGIKKRIDDLHFFVLNKHTPVSQVQKFINPALAGKDMGLISEAGIPAVADPGANIVRMAHQKQIRVSPLVGPSSIFLALMASGLNGQCFSFNGYLPVNRSARSSMIRKIEKRSANENQTQIFMETPYRNNQMLNTIIKNCKPDTNLCIAANMSLDDEFVKTMTIKNWKGRLPDLHKKPTIFLIMA